MKPSFFSIKSISFLLIGCWLIIFAFIPGIMMLTVSFLHHDTSHLFKLPFTWKNYFQLFNPLYFRVVLHSVFIAASTTLLCLVLSYPFAYFLSRLKTRYKPLLLLLVIVPFWISSLIRTYAIVITLKAKGLVNTVLLVLGLIHQPLPLLYTNTAVLIGLTYDLLPFMILPLYANMEKFDYTLVEVARDLGARWPTILCKVIIPLTMPGIIAGVLLVFLPAMTLFYIPNLLGGAKSLLLGDLIQQQFLFSMNWPLGAATSSLITLAVLLLLWLYWRQTKGQQKVELI